nr:MAG TPA: hypothetical protein [Caudoviricetes sp.]
MRISLLLFRFFSKSYLDYIGYPLICQQHF